MARPRALDDTKQREICALMTAGCSLNTAARYVGCNPITIRREAIRNPDFSDQLRQAQMLCQVNPLRALRRKAETHWRAAAWLLERTDPDQFVRRNPAMPTLDQIDEFSRELSRIVANEIEDNQLLRRILDAMNDAARQLHREVRANNQPLLDQRRRRRHEPRPILPPPREASSNGFASHASKHKT